MWQENNRKRNSSEERELKIYNSRAMGIIILIVLLFVFQIVTFTVHKLRREKLFAFNPNTITADSLQKLGFTPKQAQSVLNYRNKGGKFSIKRDFLKLYVVDSVMYNKLEAYILLPDSMAINAVAADAKQNVQKKVVSGAKRKKNGPVYAKKSDTVAQRQVNEPKNVRTKESKNVKDSTLYGRPVGKNSYICNLNTADSADLVRLYGIGGYYAKRIIEYRERLGGSFVDKRQLLEIKGFSQERYEGIERNIAVYEEDIKAFPILDADRKALERHPYIGKYAARGIVLYIGMKGREAFASALQLLEELVREHILTEDNADRLRGYLR